MVIDRNYDYMLDEGCFPENESVDLDHARHYMKNILDMLYGSASIDEFENDLEEVCAVLNMKLPENKINLRRITWQ